MKQEYGDPIVIYAKSYSIYSRGTTRAYGLELRVKGLGFRACLGLRARVRAWNFEEFSAAHKLSQSLSQIHQLDQVKSKASSRKPYSTK